MASAELPQPEIVRPVIDFAPLWAQIAVYTVIAAVIVIVAVRERRRWLNKTDLG